MSNNCRKNNSFYLCLLKSKKNINNILKLFNTNFYRYIKRRLTYIKYYLYFNLKIKIGRYIYKS